MKGNTICTTDVKTNAHDVGDIGEVLALAYSKEHEQVVDRHDYDHPVEETEQQIFIERVVNEMINGSQHNDNVEMIGRFHLEIIIMHRVRVVLQKDLKVLMLEGSVVKIKLIAH